MLNSKFFTVALLYVSAAVAAVNGAEAPDDAPAHAPAEVKIAPVDDFNYPDTSSARAAWKPMTGSPEVSLLDIGETKALRMPCSFKDSDIERASWDRSVDIDMLGCTALRFDIFCPDASPISSFTLYLRSKGGWYAAGFYPSGDGWSSVVLKRPDFRIEGTPDGWADIDTIRISAWRGGSTDTSFYIANLGLLGTDAQIVVLNGGSAARNAPPETESVRRYTANICRLMRELNLPALVISDLDLTAERLKDKKLVILPHNPVMPDDVRAAHVNYLKNGGKIIAFYSIPTVLERLTGIEDDGHLRQSFPGNFASIRAAEESLPGVPPLVRQASWNIHKLKPVKNRSNVAATWYDKDGNDTGHAAIITSNNCVAMSHVMLDDDPDAKASLLLAMVGHLLPDAWQVAAKSKLEGLGRVGPYTSFVEARRGMQKLARSRETAMQALTEAQDYRDEAIELFEQGEHSRSIAVARKAREKLVDAWCLAQSPKPGEHRAFWCHSAFGVEGMTWDESIETLADNGFTAILPNMLWGGVAYYESKVLPVAPEVKSRGDQIELCAAACKKHGIECHVWKVNWYLGGRTSDDFVNKMRSAGRLQQTFSGRPSGRIWLCPSHPANRKLEIDAMLEVATNYDVDGIHFDYIRYPNRNGCFCKRCRTKFEELTGGKIEDWPGEVRENDRLRKQWLDFRRANITAVVAAVSKRVGKLRPDVEISAAVFRNWPVDRDKVGQDWKLWCEKGYLDFVCPMDYTPNPSQFEGLVRKQLQWAGDVPCYPGIGASVWTSRADVFKVIEMIKIARRLGAPGFTIFNYSGLEARKLLPMLGKGITGEPAP